jgi:lauroyl/myristoyl acyltransferase
VHAFDKPTQMADSRWRAALRFDGAWWRKFAELGCVYGPEWWKRASPPVIAGIIFAIAKENRERVMRNQQAVLGPRPAWRVHWDAYGVFREFARSLTEAMEQWGPQPKPLDLDVVGQDICEAALKAGRGLVVVTGHFGSWEVGARVVGRLGRPLNMVTGFEPNPTVREFVHEMRTRHDFRVIYSAQSHFTGLPILQALRRNEVVGLQIEPWGPMPGTHEVPFFGRPTRFQLGPFEIARIAKAPVVAVFALRTGIRRYQLQVAGRWEPRTKAEGIAALGEAVKAYEALVRGHPSQWLHFEDLWPAAGTPVAIQTRPPLRRATGS